MYPEIIDENGDEIRDEPDENSDDDIEAQILAEASKDKNQKRIFNIFETGVDQTLFMEANGNFNTSKVTDFMWKNILENSVSEKVHVPRCLGKLSYICNFHLQIQQFFRDFLTDFFLYYIG